MLKRSPEQDRLHGLFYQAWGQATESPSYDKEVWRQLDAIIGEFTRPREVPKLTAVDFDLRLRAGDEELWRGFPIGHWLTLLSAFRNDSELPAESVAALEAWRKSKTEGA